MKINERVTEKALIIAAPCIMVFYFVGFFTGAVYTDNYYKNKEFDPPEPPKEIVREVVRETVIEVKADNVCTEIEDIWQRALGNKTYEKHVYDCTEFTRDSQDIIPYNSIQVLGFHDDTLHRWLEVCIPFEATEGKFITQDDYQKYTKKRVGLV